MFFLTRYRRRLIAGVALATLTFAQVAMAGYGCLQGKLPEPQMACDEHQDRMPSDLLCRVHFQAETQTLDLAKLSQLSVFTAPVLVIDPVAKAVRTATNVPLLERIAVGGAPPPPLIVLYSRSLT